ncbi:protein C12orf4 homolog [Anneissia japonica]|uniref:protein C12orf4 homolog n=1 Tax=Anneissia japonica TaxID=1529436 RepID=UPI0014257D0E|nr:protein C12orf4 homolog [Anneissia japonica]
MENDFQFSFKYKGTYSKLSVPISFPLEGGVDEFVGRLMTAHNLPCFIQSELQNSLTAFLAKGTATYHDTCAEEALKALQIGDDDIGNIAEKWARAFTQVWKIYECWIMTHLFPQQVDEMERAVQGLDVTHDDSQVNRLAALHFENTQLAEAKWANELINLQTNQRREFKEWVYRLNEDVKNGQEGKVCRKIRAMSDSAPPRVEEETHVDERRMEESFTIHLGAQMKTMHNLRIVCMEIHELCKHKALRIGGRIQPEPQRLQTAMSLFSNSLSGLVLLVDDRVNTYTGVKREFATICQQSTDFHFPDLETQIRVAQQYTTKANTRRQLLKGNSESSNGNCASPSDEISSNLKQGDFYITKHSNLAQVHVVFHLVTNDSVRAPDLNSRHPVIVALRSVLKCCVDFDIHCISIPLLLVYEMHEEMTISWCLKRAELVLKCIKGFMMEMASWSGNQSRTIQFIVPKGIAVDLFEQLSSMLPQIFRMSRTVDLTRQ